ncbi:MAG TPA: hypothetical protein VG847_03405 [Chitinophagaceae bacterium]|nr:hypothetical protein [Chitinophagaceae bacterium]
MATKITQYGICAANTDGELAGFVNEKIKDGYQPYGLVFISVQHDQLFFHQVIVKMSRIKKPGNNKSKKGERAQLAGPLNSDEC